MERRVGVLVIGAGPVGACCAYELAASGCNVLLVERELDACPPAAAAHGNCGLILPSHLTPLAAPGVITKGMRWLFDSGSPFYVAPRASAELVRWLWLFRAACTEERSRAGAEVLFPLNYASAALHVELAERHGERWLYRRNGLVQVHESVAGGEEAAAEVARDRALGVSVADLSMAQVRARYPRYRSSVAHAVLYEDAAHLEPLRFTRTMANLAVAAGAELATDTEVLALDCTGRGTVRAITTRGDVLAEQVVVAAGAWSPDLARGLGVSLPIQPAKGYSVDLQRPSSFPEAPFYLGEAHLVFTPMGETLRLGGTLELAGWNMAVRPRRVAGLRQAAARAFGLAAHSAPERLWRGPRPVTPDGLPVVGRVPCAERVILATGHCMLGLLLAPVTGRLVAELAGGSQLSESIAALSARRFR